MHEIYLASSNEMWSGHGELQTRNHKHRTWKAEEMIIDERILGLPKLRVLL